MKKENLYFYFCRTGKKKLIQILKMKNSLNEFENEFHLEFDK